ALVCKRRVAQSVPPKEEHMSRSTWTLDETTAAFVTGLARQGESEVLERLRRHTASHPLARMQISVEQGRLLHLLARLVGATRAIEVGVFTGYSAICVAEALRDDGYLLACDISEEWTDIARPYWEAAGVAHRIDLHIAPAAETLEAVLASSPE